MKQTVCTQNLLPIADTLDCIGGKWKLMILSVLVTEGPKRFRELQREVGGITARMLSKELKELEMNELVDRLVYATTPVTVEYGLSDYGQTLGEVMQVLKIWGINHRRRIMAQTPKETLTL